jgi:chemotaxis protein MotB
MRSFVSLALAATLLGGCVSLDKYNALKLERDQFSERLGQAESEARAERERAKLLKDQLDRLMGGVGENQSLVQTLTRQNADLQSQLDRLNKLYQDALQRAPKFTEEVTNALQDLANQSGGMFEFDPTTGVLKFKSDVTFASGSAEVTPRAKEVLARVASILNSQSVAQYDLLVVGHTDNVRVINPATIRAGHKDNWYLSAHRAITVSEQLRSGGIAGSRMGVVGYADQHPVASNATDAGKAQNRRVEILVVNAMPGASAPAAPAAAAAPKAAKAAPAAVKEETETPEAVPPSQNK